MYLKKVEPGPGQESVWDYPRPAIAEEQKGSFQIKVFDHTIINVDTAVRVLETSHPPVYYFRIADLQDVQLEESRHTSWCEWKGQASYFHLNVDGHRITDAGWFYAKPHASFNLLKHRFAIYPSKMQSCMVNGEVAEPQKGDFYGGWITSHIVGPFKGGPGTRGW